MLTGQLLSVDHVHGERSRAGIGTRIGTLKLKVESTPPPDTAPGAPAAEGSQTIKQAYHNATPLPLTSSFFPFGPEPLRFDSFSLAAPEALTKKGATVTLKVKLVDSSPDALALVVGVTASSRAYAVAVNGRLQAITFDSNDIQRWQELDSPAEAPDSGTIAGADDPRTRRLDATKGVHAVALGSSGGDPRDLVLARDGNGRPWIQVVVKKDSGSGAFEEQGWEALPDLPDDSTILDITLLTRPQNASVLFRAYIMAISETGLYRLPITNAGGASTIGWALLGDSGDVPNFASGAMLVAVQDRNWPQPPQTTKLDLVVLDADGAIFRCEIPPSANAVNWEKFDGGAPIASLEVRPAAARYGTNGFIVVAAEEGAPVPFAVRKIGGNPPATLLAPVPLDFTVGVGTSLLVFPPYDGVDDGFPLIAAFGIRGIQDRVVALWAREDSFLTSPLPPESAPREIPRGLWLPGNPPASAPPTLVVNGQRESLLSTTLKDRRLQIATFDSVVFVGAGSPGYVELRPVPGAGTVIDLGLGPVLSDAADHFYQIDRGEGLTDGDEYRFLEIVEPMRNGISVDGAKELELDLVDDDVDVDDLLVIQAEVYRVVATVGSPATKATLDRIPTGVTLGGNAVDYQKLEDLIDNNTVSPKTITGQNLATLVEVTNLSEALDGDDLVFASGDPKTRAIKTRGPLSSGTVWLLLDGGWAVLPLPASSTPISADLVINQLVTSWSSETLQRGYQNPELSWEYFDGDGWRRLDGAFQDATHHLALSGEIRFTVPDDLAETDVAGQQDYWIRARLIGGDYGRARYVSTSETVSLVTTQAIIVDTSHLRPPEILSIEAEFTLTKAIAPERVLTDNNLAVLDQTPSSAVAGAHFDLFEGLLAIEATAGEGQPLAVRALYLGFSKRFDVNPLSLYANAEEQARGGRLRADILLQRGWVRVTVKDETAALRRRGFISVFLDEAPVRAALFGHELYWLRLSLAPVVAGLDADWAPKLNGLYVNAAIADQAKTIEQEILGSSLGEPDQTFTLAEKPVLAESLELRVRERLSDEEREAIETARRDKPAIETKVPDIPGDWVLWERVDSLVGRDGDARVFRLDPARGTVSFGDGRQGKIPPAGRDRLRAFFYQSSGGTRGNVPAYAIKDLKSAPEAVESVANPVDAAGGVDTPPIDDLIATAPARLRHSDRALAPADLEALAVAWSPEIVRARTRGPEGPDEKIKLAIAMRTGSRCPVPSLARREALARYLLERAWGGLEADAIQVVPPDYVRVSVDVEVLASTADRVAQVEDEASCRLKKFLHPIEGGPDGKGWPFGRRIWPSDVHRTLSAVEGVDRIAKVELCARAESGEAADLDDLDSFALVCAEERDIRVRVLPGEGP